MTKETMSEVKANLEALKLPDVTVNEILTLVMEPLAHLEVKRADGQCFQIWTHAAVFTVDLANSRIGVAAELSAGLHAARQIVAAAPKEEKTRARRRAKRPQEETLREEKLDAAPEITESLGTDAAAESGAEDEEDAVEEVVS